MRRPNARIADVVVGFLAVLALLLAGVIIVVQRTRYDRFLYVSELGAQGSRSEEMFRWAFVSAVMGIALLSWILRDVQPRGLLLSLWRPALTLAVSAGCFLVASQVTCSRGCPMPFTSAAEPRDGVHIIAAVLGFAAGALAMLQLATTADRLMRRISVVSGLLVATIAGTGGLLSLARVNTEVGSSLEFLATGIGLAWLITITVVHVWHSLRATHVAGRPLRGRLDGPRGLVGADAVALPAPDWLGAAPTRDPADRAGRRDPDDHESPALTG